MFSRATARATRPEDVTPGVEIVPGYEVVRLMRRGGRLDTYDVYSHERDCRCVLKVLRADRVGDDRCHRDLLLEGRLLRELTHPHLVRAYEVLEAPRTAVVLETLTGSTLAAVIEDAPLRPADAVQMGLHLTSVLGYLHRRGWLHLDVKPSNVVVQGGRAVLIDLSLVSRPGHGRPGAGTDGYLSPEQVRGRDLTPACDVYGLGTTLGEALTDLLPYGDDMDWRSRRTPVRITRAFRRRLERVPPALAALVHDCIDPDPAARPGLSDVRTALTAIAVDRPAPSSRR